jgi:non-heme chloroperoxidase
MADDRKPSAGKTIVMIHGAFAGPWCFDRFRPVFEQRGWTCDAVTLPAHGGAPDDTSRLAVLGVADYRLALAAHLRSFADPPVLLGHSMGAVLAQQLAASGLARAMILASPAPRFGILPFTDGEKLAARELMGLGPFWTTAIHPNFEIAAANSLNCIPPSMRQSIFDRFGSESGRALFELFFWMFDSGAATALDVDQIRCPVMCFSGTEDCLISLATARATANGLQQAYFWEATGHGHMLLLEPQAERLAERIVDWIPT